MSAYASTQNLSTGRALYWPILIGLFIFSGFRWTIGCDWDGYLINFYIVQADLSRDLTWSEILGRSDAGHWGMLYLLHLYELPYIYVNVVTSALFFIGLHIFARRQFNPLIILVMAFPILILNMPMSAIRQAVAIGFLCVAFLAFADKKLVRFVVIIGLGSLFHSSILVFLLMAPFMFGDMNYKNGLLAAALALPGLFFLSGTESASVANSRYIETGVAAGGAVFRVGFIAATGAAFLFYLSKTWKRYSPEDYRLVLLGSLMMLSCAALLAVSSVMADRFAYYLAPLQILIFLKAGYLMPAQRQLVMVLPYAALGALFFVWTQFSSFFSLCYTPYENALFL